VWRVINRLRSIAEHGGLREDDDRRFTTHSVRQHWFARFYLVPYNIGFHMAHHVDAGVPFRNLREYHRLLHEANYLDDTRSEALDLLVFLREDILCLTGRRGQLPL
jgi:fatty acid desaturase